MIRLWANSQWADDSTPPKPIVNFNTRLGKSAQAGRGVVGAACLGDVQPFFNGSGNGISVYSGWLGNAVLGAAELGQQQQLVATKFLSNGVDASYFVLRRFLSQGIGAPNAISRNSNFTQTDVTSSRALGSVYHNTTSYPIFVSVSGNGSRTGTIQAQCDTSNPPTTFVALYGTDTGLPRCLFFIVMPGEYYTVTFDSGGSLVSWFEWTSSGVTGTKALPSRSPGTVYQNTSTTNSIVVSVTAFVPSGHELLNAYTGPTSSLATFAGAAHSIFNACVTFIVPPGYYYKITGSTSTAISVWVEWTLAGLQVPQYDETTTRALGTTYQATTGDRFVSVIATDVALTFGESHTGYSDTSATPTTVVANTQSIDDTAPHGVFWIVPANYYYKSTATGFLSSWVEWGSQPPTGVTVKGDGVGGGTFKAVPPSNLTLVSNGSGTGVIFDAGYTVTTFEGDGASQAVILKPLWQGQGSTQDVIHFSTAHVTAAVLVCNGVGSGYMIVKPGEPGAPQPAVTKLPNRFL